MVLAERLCVEFGSSQWWNRSMSTTSIPMATSVNDVLPGHVYSVNWSATQQPADTLGFTLSSAENVSYQAFTNLFIDNFALSHTKSCQLISVVSYLLSSLSRP